MRLRVFLSLGLRAKTSSISPCFLCGKKGRGEKGERGEGVSGGGGKRNEGE